MSILFIKFWKYHLYCCRLVAKSCLTLLWPHGLQLSRLLCSWEFPGKNTGLDCHFLLQGSSWPRDRTHVFCITGGFFTTEPPGKCKKPVYLQVLFLSHYHSLLVSYISLSYILSHFFCAHMSLMVCISPDSTEWQNQWNMYMYSEIQRIGSCDYGAWEVQKLQGRPAGSGLPEKSTDDTVHVQGPSTGRMHSCLGEGQSLFYWGLQLIE